MMMTKKILVADDELQLLQTVKAYLLDAGFEVILAHNGKEALTAFRRHQPDAVILDVMMPELDGFEAARIIRQESIIPILMLTARDDDFDQALGLELGADDYITKPFSPRILIARLRAVLRRAGHQIQEEAESLQFGAFNLNKSTRLATVDGVEIDLTRSEFEIWATLLAHPGRVYTRMELLERIHGDAFAAYERTVDIHIKNLRAKLKTDLIETVYGVGYRMSINE
jgi:DNA-binding response OmpR family regulator